MLFLQSALKNVLLFICIRLSDQFSRKPNGLNFTSHFLSRDAVSESFFCCLPSEQTVLVLLVPCRAARASSDAGVVSPGSHVNAQPIFVHFWTNFYWKIFLDKR